MQEEHIYFNAINQIPQIGARRFRRLLKYFDSLQEAWFAPATELLKAGLEEKTVENFVVQRKKIVPEREWEKLEREGVRLITIKDKEYPRRLKEIYDAPALLYLKGKIERDDEFAVAVVGTRKVSHYGRQVTPELVYNLSRQGITIVSGLAVGVDSLAHQAALRAKRGRTIAVLGGGIDRQSIYPPRNKKLAQEISRKGALISEYPLESIPKAEHFPQRNRIISGLSLATLVIEAPAESGALLTARSAIEQNRDVFAVPGSIYNPNSLGPHNLIKMGAKLVSSAQDILEELNLEKVEEFTQLRKIVPDSREEAELLKYLSKEPLHIDKLIQLSSLSSQEVNSALTLMEMKGKVRNLGGMQYVLSS